MTDRSEIERIQRIRDSQIASRKPRKLQRMNYVIAKEQKRHKTGLAGWLDSLSPSMVGAAIGMMFGLVIVVVLRLSLPQQWSLLAVPCFLICTMIGGVLGKATQHNY